MSEIRIYKATEIESVRLHAFAEACNAIFAERHNEMWVSVENIYFDYGQDWMYTALVTHKPSNGSILGSWQSLCPRDYKVIINCDIFADIVRYADYYVDAQLDHTDVNIAMIA